MLNVTSFPTDVPTLHQLLREQQHMIGTLKTNLTLADCAQILAARTRCGAPQGAQE